MIFFYFSFGGHPSSAQVLMLIFHPGVKAIFAWKNIYAEYQTWFAWIQMLKYLYYLFALYIIFFVLFCDISRSAQLLLLALCSEDSFGWILEVHI